MQIGYLLTTVNFEPCEVDIQHSLCILQVTYTPARGGARFSRNQWYWEIHGIEDLGGETETKLGQIQCKFLQIYRISLDVV